MRQHNRAGRVAALSAQIREADDRLRDAIQAARHRAVQPLEKQWRMSNVLARTETRVRPAGILPDLIADLAHAGVTREELRATIGAAVDRMIVEATPTPAELTAREMRAVAVRESNEAEEALLALAEEDTPATRAVAVREIEESQSAFARVRAFILGAPAVQDRPLWRA